MDAQGLELVIKRAKMRRALQHVQIAQSLIYELWGEVDWMGKLDFAENVLLEAGAGSDSDDSDAWDEVDDLVMVEEIENLNKWVRAVGYDRTADRLGSAYATIFEEVGESTADILDLIGGTK